MPPRYTRRWITAPVDAHDVEELCKELNLHPLIATILAARGLTSPQEVDTYLNPSIDALSDPMRMCNMRKAVHRTLKAFHNRDPILVFGDYDVDGVTAASCVYQFLHRLGIQVECAIPLRSSDGYGLTVERVQQAWDDGIRLLITTDCGISSLEEITYAKKLGLDVIVIDHHAIPNELPPAEAILNPLLPTCDFPFKRLAAVGVSFNFIRALHATLKELGAFPGGAPDLGEYLDITALGTVADAVPLIGDNRILVRLGLEVLRKRRRPGVSALMERAQIDGRPVTARTIGYRLAPLLNAAGRMGHAGRCVRLLSTNSYREADQIARELEQDNNLRQKYERQILAEAVEIAEKEFNAGYNLLMLSGEHWHEGVLGIVASRIKEMFHRPAALVSVNQQKQKARVSLRSIEGIDLVAAMRTIEEHLDSYGGHTAAAGMTLPYDKLSFVKDALNKAIMEQVGTIPPPTLKVDARCTFSQLDTDFLEELQNMEPFGSGNPEPLLMVQDTRAIRRRIVGNKHLRLQLRNQDRVCEAIGFALAPQAHLLRDSIDVVLTPRQTMYRDKPRLEIQLKDLRRAESLGEEDRQETDHVS